MAGNQSALDSDAPLFVLATRLYVHYKFKTRKSFEPQAVLIDDAYAREVLAQVRAVPDARLKEIADRFEAARFPGSVTAPAPERPVRAADQDEPMLDLSLDTPG